MIYSQGPQGVEVITNHIIVKLESVRPPIHHSRVTIK